MEKGFYKEQLVKLKDLVERTEKMLDNTAKDDLINLFSYRSRLKGLVDECNIEVNRRIKDENSD